MQLTRGLASAGSPSTTSHVAAVCAPAPTVVAPAPLAVPAVSRMRQPSTDWVIAGWPLAAASVPARRRIGGRPQPQALDREVDRRERRRGGGGRAGRHVRRARRRRARRRADIGVARGQPRAAGVVGDDERNLRGGRQRRRAEAGHRPRPRWVALLGGPDPWANLEVAAQQPLGQRRRRRRIDGHRIDAHALPGAAGAIARRRGQRGRPIGLDRRPVGHGELDPGNRGEAVRVVAGDDALEREAARLELVRDVAPPDDRRGCGDGRGVGHRDRLRRRPGPPSGERGQRQPGVAGVDMLRQREADGDRPIAIVDLVGVLRVADPGGRRGDRLAERGGDGQRPRDV